MSDRSDTASEAMGGKTVLFQKDTSWRGEIYFWLGIALAIQVTVLANHSLSPHPSHATVLDVILDHKEVLYVSLFLTLAPLVIKMIFGYTPYLYFASRMQQARQSAEMAGDSHVVERIDANHPALDWHTYKYVKAIDQFDPRQLLVLYTVQSSMLARRIYSRAGVHLLFGVAISIAGLLFFYDRSISTTSDSHNHSFLIMDWLFAHLPNFGILFFVEFIAFFFFKQYKFAMDEFRYYDAIRRNREENLLILKMFAENPAVISTRDVLNAMDIYSGQRRLGTGETTEILEARRLQSDEGVIFEKMIDALTSRLGIKSGK